MTLKTCSCGITLTTKNTTKIGRMMGLLLVNCHACHSTRTIKETKPAKELHVKTLIFVLIALSRVCEPATAYAGGPVEKSYPCQMFKVNGQLTIRCSDKSSSLLGGQLPTLPPPQASAPATSAPPTLHIRDANGTEYKNLIHLSTTSPSASTLLNITTGHVLSFDPNGAQVKLTNTMYETANCSGQAYAYPSSGPMVKNRIVGVLATAFPTSVDALVVTGIGTPIVRSRFTNGNCVSFTSSGASLAIVEPISSDASDPVSLALPLEIINSN